MKSTKEKMIEAAEKAGVLIDEKIVEKIAAFRDRCNVPMSKCPCDPDNEGRGCVGKVCLEEMKFGRPDKDGKCWCHCHCFYLKGK